MAEGIAVENLISALISMNYKHEVIDIEDSDGVRRFSEEFDAVRLNMSVGKNANVQTGNIVAAIIEETGISSKSIGRIDVRATFTLVDIDASKVDLVLEKMQGAQIRGNQIEIQIDEAPKRKKGSSSNGGYNRRSSSSRSSGSSNRNSSSKERGGKDGMNKGRRGSSRNDRSVRKTKVKK